MATRPPSLQHVVGDAFDPKALGAMFRDLRERIEHGATFAGMRIAFSIESE